MARSELLFRFLVFFIGIIVLAFGIALIIEADLGVSAWDVLHIGLFYTFGLTIGTWSIIVGLLIVVITLLLDREMVAIGTILNMFFVGIFIDIFLYILPTSSTGIFQYSLLLLGITISGMGAGLYITAKIGSGPRDGLMLVLAKRLGYSIGKIKTIMEIMAVILGFLLGGPVFWGTIISAVLIGPIMQFSLKWWDQALKPVFAVVKTKEAETMQ